MLTLLKIAWKWAAKHVTVKASANEYAEVPEGAFLLIREKIHLSGTTNVYLVVYIKI